MCAYSRQPRLLRKCVAYFKSNFAFCVFYMLADTQADTHAHIHSSSLHVVNRSIHRRLIHKLPQLSEFILVAAFALSAWKFYVRQKTFVDAWLCQRKVLPLTFADFLWWQLRLVCSGNIYIPLSEARLGCLIFVEKIKYEKTFYKKYKYLVFLYRNFKLLITFSKLKTVKVNYLVIKFASNALKIICWCFKRLYPLFVLLFYLIYFNKRQSILKNFGIPWSRSRSPVGPP